MHDGWVDALGEATAQAEMPVSGRAPMLTPMLTAMLSACSPISRGDAAVRARGLSAASMSLSSAAALLCHAIYGEVVAARKNNMYRVGLMVGLSIACTLLPRIWGAC